MPELVWGILIGSVVSAVAGFLWSITFGVDIESSLHIAHLDEQSRRMNAERELGVAKRTHEVAISQMQDKERGKEARIQAVAQEMVNRAHQECGTALRQCHEREAALISQGGGR